MKLSKFLIALGLAAVAATPVVAQSALEQIKQAGALRIGTDGGVGNGVGSGGAGGKVDLPCSGVNGQTGCS